MKLEKKVGDKIIAVEILPNHSGDIFLIEIKEIHQSLIHEFSEVSGEILGMWLRNGTGKYRNIGDNILTTLDTFKFYDTEKKSLQECENIDEACAQYLL